MMTCDDVLNLVDLIASEELAADAATTAHISTCASCAAALGATRRLDALLRDRPVAMPPAQFTSRTMARIRRMRWRNEQMIDWGFNAALIGATVLVAAGIWVVVSCSGLTFISSDALQLFGAGMRAFVQRVSPSFPLYVLATVLLVTALGIWWWAERGAAL